MKCRIPHPTYTSYRCQRDEGHEGNHSARKNGRTRIWRPYLSVFAALAKPLTQSSKPLKGR